MSYVISVPWQERGWRLDKRIPLMLIMVLTLHLGAALVWAAQLDIRVAQIEKNIDRIDSKLDAIPALVAGSGTHHDR